MLVIDTVGNNVEVSTVTVFEVMFFNMRIQVTLTRKNITVTLSAYIYLLALKVSIR